MKQHFMRHMVQYVERKQEFTLYYSIDRDIFVTRSTWNKNPIYNWLLIKMDIYKYFEYKARYEFTKSLTNVTNLQGFLENTFEEFFDEYYEIARAIVDVPSEPQIKHKKLF